VNDPYVDAGNLYEKTYTLPDGLKIAVEEIDRKRTSAYSRDQKEHWNEVEKWIRTFYDATRLWPVFRPSRKVRA